METNSRWDRVVELARISLENPAAAAVLSLHQPVELGHCDECGRLDSEGMRDTSWPCPTVRAIEEVVARPQRIDFEAMKVMPVPPRLLQEWADCIGADRPATVSPGDLPGHPLVNPSQNRRAADDSTAPMRPEAGRSTVLGPVEKFSTTIQLTSEEFTDALQRLCLEMGLDATGTDEELQARIDARWSEIHAAVGRRFDEAFPTTPDQLPGNPFVQPKESP